MSKETFMIEEITKEMVMQLINDKNLPMQDALLTVYTSDTYAKLIDLNTGLYFQSTTYVYEYLMNEISVGKMI